MLTKYSVKNFKIHQDDNEIEFPGLTILTGTNNSGKSSMIQSIRAFSLLGSSTDCCLPLDRVEGLGSLKDVLNKNVNRSECIVYNLYFRLVTGWKAHVMLEFGSALAGGDFRTAGQPDAALLMRIRIVLERDEISCVYVFSYAENGMYLWEEEIGDERRQLGYVKFMGLQPLSNLAEIDVLHKRVNLEQCFGELKELSVEYLGPYRSVAAYMPAAGYRFLDTNGNNASEIISRWKDEKIFDGTIFAEAFANWTARLLNTEFTVKMENNQYRLVAMEEGVEFGLNQIGFGNTQILPVIVQVLTAKAGDLVIIENPEVHLHPKWKADLIELFFHAASHGVKIVLETQSMEMINRVRVMVKKAPELADKTALYFFEKRNFECEINRVEIEKTGQLDVWPENFLDRVTIEDSFELL